jgi:hypothetical protein
MLTLISNFGGGLTSAFYGWASLKKSKYLKYENGGLTQTIRTIETEMFWQCKILEDYSEMDRNGIMQITLTWKKENNTLHFALSLAVVKTRSAFVLENEIRGTIHLGPISRIRLGPI